MGRAVAALWVVLAASLAAQGPPGGRAGGPPPTAKAAARVDFTGNWVSVVSEDWRWRMITPARGDYANIPINAAARKIADTWDPAKDQSAGEACKAYAAPAIMREPGRLQITWQDDNTLKIETDAGMQCVAKTEICNNLDDDCDGKADDGFDLMNDEQNCGTCGHQCNTGPNRTCCGGTCKKVCQ